MDEIYRKKHIYAEGWTNHELEIYSKRAKTAVLISILASVFLIIAPLILIKNYSYTVTMIITLYALLSIGLGALVIFWSQSFKQATVSDDTLGTVETIEFNKSYSTIILVYSFFMILLSGFLAILVAFWKDVGDDYYVAQYGSQTHYVNQYYIMMNIVIPLVIINGFLQGVVAFASYITMDQKEYLRVLIYLFTSIFAFTAFCTLYFVKSVQSFSQNPTVPVQFSSNLINFCVYQCFIAIFVLSTITLVTNFFKKTNNYFIMGSLILVSVFCFALTQYLFFKTTIKMRSAYSTQCPQQLRLTEIGWLKINAHCDKYVTDKDTQTYNQQCSQQELAQTWDVKETNQLACLNMDCCEAMSYAYTRVHFAAAFSLFSTVVFGFALTISLFQISTKVHDFTNTDNSKDYLCIFLFIVIVITGIFFYISVGQITLPQRATIMADDQQSFQNVVEVNPNHLPIVYPKNFQGVTGCQPLSKVYGKKFVFTQCTTSSQTCTSEDTAVRASFLTQGAALLVTEYTNSANLFYIQQQVGQQLIFPNSEQTPNGFLSVEGMFQDVASFLNSNVQVCKLTDINAQAERMNVDIFYLPLPVAITVQTNQQQNNPKRQLTHHFQQTETGSFELNQKQNQYLDSLTFTNLQVKVNLEGNTTRTKNYAELMFFKAIDDCGSMNSIPSRFLKTDNQGDLLIYNLVAKQYFFGIRVEGYYLYCNSFLLSVQKNIKIQQIDIALIKKDQKKGQFSVVLQQQIIPYPVGQKAVQQEYTMSLASTFETTTPKAICEVGYVFNWVCGGMQFSNEESSQVINVSQLVQTIYTFYVQFMPTNSDLQALNQKKAQGNSLTQDESKTIDNNYIWDQMSPVLTLYANEQEGPIVQYQLSKLPRENQEPNLTWLALCVDGNVGDVTQTSPQKFWNYVEKPDWSQRTQNSQDMFPSANICEQFYSQS